MGQNYTGAAIPCILCGRPFDAEDLERIRREIVAANTPLRSESARRVCRGLEWTDALGRLKLMSARVGLVLLHRAGLNRAVGAEWRQRQWLRAVLAPERLLEPAPVGGTVGELSGVRLDAVIELSTSRLRNGLIARCHYLGYTPLPEAQLRYPSPPRRCVGRGHRL